MKRISREFLNRYLSAAIVVKGKYLLLRSAYKNEFLEQGYYFPGCSEGKDSNEKTLANQLYLKYKLRITVEDLIGDVIVKISPRKYGCLYLYRCLLKKDSLLNSTDVIAQLVSPEDFDKIRFDKADGYLAERIRIFHPAYQNQKRVTELSKEERDKVYDYFKCLLFNMNTVTDQDMTDFKHLLLCESDFIRIEQAFNFILKRSHVSYEIYRKKMDKLAKKQKRKQGN